MAKKTVKIKKKESKNKKASVKPKTAKKKVEKVKKKTTLKAKTSKVKPKATKIKAAKPKVKVSKAKVKKEKAESIEEKPVFKLKISKQKLDNTIYSVAGENGVKVIHFLGDQHNVSEFIIAEKLKLDMQTIRNTLYKLHTFNIATYIRKKDRLKGWYISYWTFNKKRIGDLIKTLKKRQLDKLKERLRKEEESKGIFYICPKACARLDFDQATEFEYRCPECGSLLNQQENTRTIEHLRGQIDDLQCSI